jgi:hypothetical protein
MSDTTIYIIPVGIQKTTEKCLCRFSIFILTKRKDNQKNVILNYLTVTLLQSHNGAVGNA